MDALKSIKLWTSKFLVPQKIIYPLSPERIDVVIPCIERDMDTLEACIEGVMTYGKKIRRVIVVSKKELTKSAEWFPEEGYPFSLEEISLAIFRGNAVEAERFIEHKNSRIGWIMQQLIKLYATSVIPDISSNVLVLDADVIFVNSTEYMTNNGEPLFNTGREWHEPYFEHAQRLLPFLHRVYPQYSGICHYMLFQRSIIQDLFVHIQRIHQLPPWQAICRCIDRKEIFKSALSEYEIYFNFALLRTEQVHIHPLKWVNLDVMDYKEKYRNEKYHYMACQAWQRACKVSQVEIFG